MKKLISLILLLAASAGAQSVPQPTSTEPIAFAATVTPNDSVDLPNQCRALYIGGNGNVRMDVARGGTNILFSAVKGGSVLPIRVKRVRSTGTTAANLVCLY